MEVFNNLFDGNLVGLIISSLLGAFGAILSYETTRKNQLIKMTELIHESNKELRQQLKDQEEECRKDNNALRVRIRNLENQILNK